MSENASSDIGLYRTAKVKLTLTGKKEPIAGQEIAISQKNHKFLFGCTAFDTIPLSNGDLEGDEKARVEDVCEKRGKLFNLAIFPFYWGFFESKKGEPNTKRFINAAKWCISHGYRVKGHPLCWHTNAPGWLLDLDNHEILNTLLSRIERDVTDFKELIGMWDVINEAVIMPVFDKYDNGITRICKEMGRIKTVKTVFDAARAANPAAVFLINDFDITPAYDILIEGCLEAGIKFDAIGIQSHMHQGYWGVEKTLKTIDHFARFKLPIHFTENSILSGAIMPPEYDDLNDYKVDEWPSTKEGEERQAAEVSLHYRTLFANPLVESITWWDILDGRWLKAPSGLIRKDNSIKPAYEELLKLIKGEWWMEPETFKTDKNGNVEFTGFLGDYEIIYKGVAKSVSLDRKGEMAAAVRFDN